MIQSFRALKRSTLLTLVGGVVLAALSFSALEVAPRARAQMRGPAFTPRVISSTHTDNLNALREQDASIANLAEFVSPGVVHIRSTSKGKRDLFGAQLPQNGGEGSGVIFRPDGYIVTNDHVVGGYDQVKVVLNDGREFEGKVIRAQEVDIAVVKIEAKDLPTLPFGDSSRVRAGQFSMAVGSPFGLENSVTIGHISALGRTSEIADNRVSGPRYYPGLLQTDTPINMGNSGGPLVNIEGEVIGINTAIYSPTGLSAGIGFAIPSNTARLIAEKLIQDGKLTRAAMGLRPVSLKPYKAKELGVEGGAVVAQPPVNGSPAAMVGMKEGDIILRIGNVPVKSESDVRTSMLSYEPGEKVKVEVLRDGKRKSFEVKLIEASKLPTPRSQAPRIDQSPFGPEFDLPEELKRRLREQEEEVPPLREGPPKLGVTVEDLTSTLREQFSVPKGVSGAIVTSVAPGSIADKVGLEPGDVIEQLGDKKIPSADALQAAIRAYNWGDQATIRYSRYGEKSAVSQARSFTFR